MSDTLDDLESRSIYILREAYSRVNPMAMLWSIGKDSTAMLWLVKKAFFGRVPFPLVLLDTEEEMDEVYAFRDWLTIEWDLPVINHLCPPIDTIDKTLPPATRAAMRKTEGLKSLLKEHQYKGVVCGIRRDEQGLRAKERVFSPRSLDGSWDLKISRRSSGINIKPKCRMIVMCGFTRYCIGQKLIFGVIRKPKIFRYAIFILPKTECAIARSVRKILPSRCRAKPTPSKKLLPSSKQPTHQNALAARWIRKPKIVLSV